ncbi:hypothetical protein DH2020_020256 [Rehmannia glutinosa]|uniref:SANTA domain-containing protein n=1 Tax=Rehmannia glutinosa TaxID=99300 RepID=A0ABR0WFQ4_REHGL
MTSKGDDSRLPGLHAENATAANLDAGLRVPAGQLSATLYGARGDETRALKRGTRNSCTLGQRRKQAMRVFSSAPILKRYDAFTIETTDGICVIFKGFINKAQTVENGFPSDVYDHFVFGFPPYWKECEENLMGKESTSKDVLGFNLLKRLSPQSEMESAQPHIDNCEKDLGSQGKVDVKGMRKSKKTKSSAVPLPKKSDSVISGSKCNLIMSCNTPGDLETESYSGGPTVEDHTTLDMPVNCRKNKMISLSDSSLGGNLNTSAVTDEVVDDSQIHASKGILSACHLLNRSTDNLRKVVLDRRKSTKANFNKDMSSSEASLTHTEGRVRTRSMSSLKMKQKNEKKSAIITGGEKIRSNCVSSMGSNKFAPVDCEPKGRNNWNSEVIELHGPADKIKPSEFEAGSVKDKCVQISKTPNQNNDLRKVKTKGNIENVIPEINSLSDKGKASDTRTRRKLAYVSKLFSGITLTTTIPL